MISSHSSATNPMLLPPAARAQIYQLLHATWSAYAQYVDQQLALEMALDTLQETSTTLPIADMPSEQMEHLWETWCDRARNGWEWDDIIKGLIPVDEHAQLVANRAHPWAVLQDLSSTLKHPTLATPPTQCHPTSRVPWLAWVLMGLALVLGVACMV